MLGMVLPAFIAALVLGIGESPERRLLDGAAEVVAVPLTAVIAATDVERPSATATAQREQKYLVHPSRKDENWTTASGPSTVVPYRLSIRWPYMRVQAPTWALLRFIRGSDLQQPAPLREFLAPTRRQLGPLGSGDPGENGPEGGR